jgi:hypothetical protein
MFRAPETFRGVRLESHRSLRRLVSGEPRLGGEDLDLLLRLVATALPPR